MVQLEKHTQGEAFDTYRPLLFSIAYRMLGSVMDAEDIVQEAYLRWQGADHAGVQSVKSYLSAVVTRLSIDHLRLAQTQRETYVGEWLPEPLVMGYMPGLNDLTLRTESLSMAFLLMLERLSPIERAVFLLREVFDYDYAEIAQIVDKSEANCRQMLRRAHQHIDAEGTRYQASRQQQEHMIGQFIQACANGDLNGLLALLTEDIVSQSDGGGKVSAAIHPIIGADHVARFLLGVIKKRPDDYGIQIIEINSQPAIVSYSGNRPYNVLQLEVDITGKIRRLYTTLNPDKLKAIPLLRA